MLQQGVVTHTPDVRPDLLVGKPLPVEGLLLLFFISRSERMLRKGLVKVIYNIAGVLNGFIVMRKDWQT